MLTPWLSQNVDSGGRNRQHSFRRRTYGEATTKNSQHNKGMSHFLAVCFIVLHRYCVFFNKCKVSGNPNSNKFISVIFPTVFAHFVYPCHILVVLPVVQTCLLLLYLLQQSAISDIECHLVIVFGAQEPCPHKMANDKFCVRSNWSTDQLFHLA